MTLCPYNPNAATDCLWNLAGDATALAVACLAFTVIALFGVLAVTLTLRVRRLH